MSKEVKKDLLHENEDASLIAESNILGTAHSSESEENTHLVEIKVLDEEISVVNSMQNPIRNSSKVASSSSEYPDSHMAHSLKPSKSFPLDISYRREPMGSEDANDLLYKSQPTYSSVFQHKMSQDNSSSISKITTTVSPNFRGVPAHFDAKNITFTSPTFRRSTKVISTSISSPEEVNIALAVENKSCDDYDADLPVRSKKKSGPKMISSSSNSSIEDDESYTYSSVFKKDKKVFQSQETAFIESEIKSDAVKHSIRGIPLSHSYSSKECSSNKVPYLVAPSDSAEMTDNLVNVKRVSSFEENIQLQPSCYVEHIITSSAHETDAEITISQQGSENTSSEHSRALDDIPKVTNVQSPIKPYVDTQPDVLNNDWVWSSQNILVRSNVTESEESLNDLPPSANTRCYLHFQSTGFEGILHTSSNAANGNSQELNVSTEPQDRQFSIGVVENKTLTNDEHQDSEHIAPQQEPLNQNVQQIPINNCVYGYPVTCLRIHHENTTMNTHGLVSFFPNNQSSHICWYPVVMPNSGSHDIKNVATQTSFSCIFEEQLEQNESSGFIRERNCHLGEVRSEEITLEKIGGNFLPHMSHSSPDIFFNPLQQISSVKETAEDASSLHHIQNENLQNNEKAASGNDFGVKDQTGEQSRVYPLAENRFQLSQIHKDVEDTSIKPSQTKFSFSRNKQAKSNSIRYLSPQPGDDEKENKAITTVQSKENDKKQYSRVQETLQRMERMLREHTYKYSKHFKLIAKTCNNWKNKLNMPTTEDLISAGISDATQTVISNLQSEQMIHSDPIIAEISHATETVISCLQSEQMIHLDPIAEEISDATETVISCLQSEQMIHLDPIAEEISDATEIVISHLQSEQMIHSDPIVAKTADTRTTVIPHSSSEVISHSSSEVISHSSSEVISHSSSEVISHSSSEVIPHYSSEVFSHSSSEIISHLQSEKMIHSDAIVAETADIRTTVIPHSSSEIISHLQSEQVIHSDPIVAKTADTRTTVIPHSSSEVISHLPSEQMIHSDPIVAETADTRTTVIPHSSSEQPPILSDVTPTYKREHIMHENRGSVPPIVISHRERKKFMNFKPLLSSDSQTSIERGTIQSCVRQTHKVSEATLEKSPLQMLSKTLASNSTEHHTQDVTDIKKLHSKGAKFFVKIHSPQDDVTQKKLINEGQHLSLQDIFSEKCPHVIKSVERRKDLLSSMKRSRHLPCSHEYSKSNKATQTSSDVLVFRPKPSSSAAKHDDPREEKNLLMASELTLFCSKCGHVLSLKPTKPSVESDQPIQQLASKQTDNAERKALYKKLRALTSKSKKNYLTDDIKVQKELKKQKKELDKKKIEYRLRARLFSKVVTREALKGHVNWKLYETVL